MTALKGLDARLKTAKLHLITDLRARQGDLREFLVEAIRGGVDLVQLRDPQASTEALVKGLELARSIAYQLDAGVVVGSNLTAAQRFEADYLHLGAADGPTNRTGLHDFAMLGRSVHDERQLAAAGADELVDWLFVGPVFGDASLQLPGLDLVRAAAREQVVDQSEAKPWFAVGGINTSTIEQVVEAGAVRVAVSSAITGADDPRAAAEQLSSVLREAWAARPAMERYALSAFGGGGITLRGAPTNPF